MVVKVLLKDGYLKNQGKDKPNKISHKNAIKHVNQHTNSKQTE